MKTINLDADKARQELESVAEGQLFKCVKQLGSSSKWFAGYINNDGVFTLVEQELGKYHLSPSDAYELIDWALGNTANEAMQPTREELEDEAEYQRLRHNGPCLPFDGGVM